MCSKGKFAVTFPPIYARLDLAILGFFVIVIVLNTLFSPPPHTAMYGWITAIVFIPGALVLLWVKTFKIEVDGMRISVRRCLGFVRYSFDISEIIKVEAKTVESGVGRIKMMRVYVPGGRNFPVENLLVNSDKLMRLIVANIPEDKLAFR